MRLTNPASICRRYELTPYHVREVLIRNGVPIIHVAGRPMVLDAEFFRAVAANREMMTPAEFPLSPAWRMIRLTTTSAKTRPGAYNAGPRQLARFGSEAGCKPQRNLRDTLTPQE